MRYLSAAQSEGLAELERALGYAFLRPELLLQALAHRSQTSGLESEDSLGEGHGRERTDNERLEYLGDAVLGLLVTEALFEDYPDWQEGELTQLRAQLVNRQHLAKVAGQIGLGEHVRMSRDIERAGGRKNAYILANTMEAVLAAMYLDSSAATGSPGSFEPVRRFARRRILGETARELAMELRSGSALGNFKSKLQEQLQAAGAGMPVYFLVSVTGPDHRKRFVTEVRVRAKDGTVGEPLATGEGVSRKKAEQEAARQALSAVVARSSAQAPAQASAEDPAVDPAEEPSRV